MDYIEGETLDVYLQRRGNKLHVDEVLDIGIELCNVLNYLHTHQPPIIFRDLKPGNVMRTDDGHLFLIDFGIARYFKPGQARDTIALGSPGFAAPEQYGKAQTTPRADIYSLGAMLHFMLSGTDPSEEPFHFEPLKNLPTDYADVGPLITQMLDMKANKRPDNIAEVKAALQQIQECPPGTVQPSTPLWYSPTPTPVPLAYTAPSYVPTQSPQSALPLPSPSAHTATFMRSRFVSPRNNLVCIYSRHANKIRAVAWSPDSQYIVTAAAEDTVIQVWKAL